MEWVRLGAEQDPEQHGDAEEENRTKDKKSTSRTEEMACKSAEERPVEMGVMRAKCAFPSVSLPQRQNRTPVIMRVQSHQDCRNECGSDKRDQALPVVKHHVDRDGQREKRIRWVVEHRHPEEEAAEGHPAALWVSQQRHGRRQEEKRRPVLQQTQRGSAPHRGAARVYQRKPNRYPEPRTN